MTWFGAILLIFLALPALGEPVTVRSGDHADFSRLLLEYDDGGTGWVFGKVEGGYEFRPARADIAWDLRRAFDRISRDRIRALEDRGDGRLFVAVDCACHADAFVLRTGQIVLDIKDGAPPLAASPFELDLAPVASAQAAAGRPDTGPRAVAPPFAAAARSAPINDRAGLPLMSPLRPDERFSTRPAEPPAPPAFGEDVGAADPDAAARTATRVAETEAALIEQIARAAAQGLIDADMSRLEREVRAATQPIAPPAPEKPAEGRQPDPSPAVTPRGHVSVETGVDRAAPSHGTKTIATEDGAACLDPALFDIASWGAPLDNGADFGAFRAHLLGEFDVANPDGVFALARYYLYATFGAEAKALLRQYPDAVANAGLLSTMADIIDQAPVNGVAELADQMACDGATALWATLAQPALHPGQAIKTDAVSLAFAGLPKHLRQHLGPELAEKFLKIGDRATAEQIRNAMARGALPDDPGLDLLNARLDLASGEPARAEARLEVVTSRESEVLPEALLAQVTARLERGEAIAPDQISLLQSLGFEAGETQRGAALRDAEVRARAASGDFAMAFQRLAEARTSALLAPERVVELTDAVFSALAQDAAAPSFLELSVPRLEAALDLPSPTRRAIATRFLDLGLAGPARAVLAGAGALPDKADRALFARAAMIEGHPEIAVGYLAGIDGDAATQLRAEAMVAAGDYAEATRLYDMGGDPERGTLAAWRGGLWETLATRPAGAISAAAERMLGADKAGETAAQSGGDGARHGAQSGPPPPTTPLARSQQLIDESRAARAVLDDLLGAVAPLPSEAGS